MILLLAQTTQNGDHGMSTWSPAEWALFFAGLLGFITGLLGYLKGNNAQNTSNTNTQNIQTLGAGQSVLAGKMRQSTAIDNPPPSVEVSSLSIAASPSTVTPIPPELAAAVWNADPAALDTDTGILPLEKP